MQVSLFRKTFGRLDSDKDLYQIFADIKKGVHIAQIMRLRELLKQDKKKYQAAKVELPCFTISGTFLENKGAKGYGPPEKKGLKKYNGIVGLDYDGFTTDKVCKMIERCRQIPYTLAAFVSPSGKGFKVFVQTNNNNHKNHFDCYKSVAAHYDEVLMEQHDSSGCNINRLCYLSSDADLYLNKKARVFGFVPVVREEQIKPTINFDAKIEAGSTGEYLAKALARMETRSLYYVEGQRHNYIKSFSVECYNYGIAESDCLAFIDDNFLTADCQVDKVAQLVNNIYSNNQQPFGLYQEWAKVNRPKGKKKQATPTPAAPPQETEIKLYQEHKLDNGIIDIPKMQIDEWGDLPKAIRAKLNHRQRLEDTLAMYFEFRINTLKKQEEYRQLGENGWKQWRKINKIEYNSIVLALGKAGVLTSAPQIESIVLSHFSKQENPLKSHFENFAGKLKEGDKTDYIDKLASIVKTSAEKGLWQRIFKKWMVASVANVYVERHCTNHQCLLLLSPEQGFGKTEFWSSLFDSDYTFTGHVNFKNKDSTIMLADTFLVVLDEQLSVLEDKKELEQLKSFITLPKVKERWHYDKSSEFAPRVANICGTANDIGILYDDTGNRRFLPFQVTEKIDRNKVSSLDIAKAWGQAYQLYKEGWYYLPTKTENAELDAYKKQFKRIDDVHHFINELFHPYDQAIAHPTETEHLFTSAEILEKINKRFKPKDLTVRLVGSAMKLLEFKQRDVTRPTDNRRARFWSTKLGGQTGTLEESKEETITN